MTDFTPRKDEVLERYFKQTSIRSVAGRRRLTHAVVRDVAEAKGLSVADIMGPRRFAPLVAARAAVAKRLHAAGMSVADIGRCINRDHSTVLYHVHGGMAWRKNNRKVK